MQEQKPSLFTKIKNDWESLPPIAKTVIKVGGFVAAGAAIAIVGVATLGAAPALAVAGFAVAAGGYKAFKKDKNRTERPVVEIPKDRTKNRQRVRPFGVTGLKSSEYPRNRRADSPHFFRQERPARDSTAPEATPENLLSTSLEAPTREEQNNSSIRLAVTQTLITNSQTQPSPVKRTSSQQSR